MGQSQLSSSLKKIYSAVRWLVLEISKRHSRELKTCFREDAVEGFKGGTNGRRWRYSLRPKVRGKHESTEEIDALLWQKERWRESNREREFQHELSTYCLTDPPRLWLLLSSPVCALVEPPTSAERRSWGRRRIKDLPIITVLFSPCFCCCCLLLFLPPAFLSGVSHQLIWRMLLMGRCSDVSGEALWCAEVKGCGWCSETGEMRDNVR